MYSVFTPTLPSHSRTAVVVNSLPLSLRTCSGTPRVAISHDSRSRTSSEPSCLATSIDRHSRVHSSTTTRSRSGSPSCVRASTKSYAHTWPFLSGRSLTQLPSFSHRLPRRSCFLGTFRPACLQMRSTRLWFTFQPSFRSIPVIRGDPYRPYTDASSMIRPVSSASSSRTRAV
jgi:hypothetical protein